MEKRISELIDESIRIKKLVLEKEAGNIEKAARAMLSSFGNNCKLLLFGNGGSAADSQHIATELVHQFEKKGRKGLPAIALTTDTSTLTAIGNDWGFGYVFERQVEALADEGDVAFGISTSGNSENVCWGLKKAKELGCTTIALLGGNGGKAKGIADICIIVPGEVTARVQEAHIMIGHILCSLIEEGIADD